MLPAFDSGEDAVGVGGPYEGLGVCIGFLDEAVDGALEIDDGVEDPALQHLPGQLGKKAFDGVEPGGRGRREVEGPTRMVGEPGAHLGVLVGRVVVTDRMDHLARRHLRLDGVEEADELLMAMALHVAADDGAVQHVERRKQRGEDFVSPRSCKCKQANRSLDKRFRFLQVYACSSRNLQKAPRPWLRTGLSGILASPLASCCCVASE